MCNCLCSVVHPRKRGICTGEQILSIPFKSDLTGTVDVAMCRPCAEAVSEIAKLKKTMKP